MPHVKLDSRLQPFVAMLFGAVLGVLGAAAIMPTLRTIDPIGVTPVAMIATAGIAVLWWYLRGRLVVHRQRESFH